MSELTNTLKQTIMKVNAKYIKEVSTHVDYIVRKYGVDEACKMVSNVLHDLSTDADAIYNTNQIFYYAHFLKHLKENYIIKEMQEYLSNQITH